MRATPDLRNADTEDEGVRLAHEKWPSSGVPGELNQVLPSPRHFEQAAQLVPPEMTREHFVCGPDPDGHLEKIEAYRKAGFTEVATRRDYYPAGTGREDAIVLQLELERS